MSQSVWPPLYIDQQVFIFFLSRVSLWTTVWRPLGTIRLLRSGQLLSKTLMPAFDGLNWYAAVVRGRNMYWHTILLLARYSAHARQFSITVLGSYWWKSRRENGERGGEAFISQIACFYSFLGVVFPSPVFLKDKSKKKWIQAKFRTILNLFQAITKPSRI